MPIYLDTNATHHVVAASSHTYLDSTQEVSINRTLAHHDIVYLVDGEWSFIETVNGKEIEHVLKPDDILFLSAGHHNFIKKPCAPGTRTYCIHITSEGHDMDSDYLKNLIIEPHFSCAANNRIIKCFKGACDAFWSTDSYAQAKADAYITLLLCEIAELGKTRTYSREVMNAIRIIDQNLTKECERGSLQDEIIKSSGLSYKKLLSIFKEETGQTIYSYHINRKLEMAAQDIENDSDIRLKELADKYNFYDEFHLSKLFKKKYGLSPTEYKKKHSNRRHRYDTIC